MLTICELAGSDGRERLPTTARSPIPCVPVVVVSSLAPSMFGSTARRCLTVRCAGDFDDYERPDVSADALKGAHAGGRPATSGHDPAVRSRSEASAVEDEHDTKAAG